MIAFWVVNKEDIFIFNYQCFNCPSNFFSGIKHLNYNIFVVEIWRTCIKNGRLKLLPKILLRHKFPAPILHTRWFDLCQGQITWFFQIRVQFVSFLYKDINRSYLDLKVAKDLLECNDHDLILFVWKSMSPSLNSNETDVPN